MAAADRLKELGFVITNNTDAIGQMLNGTGLVMLALLAALFSTSGWPSGPVQALKRSDVKRALGPR